MINYFQNVVVIAPHPDDETLGLGGSIKRLTMKKAKVSILVVSGHLPPLYKKKEFDQTLSESKKVFKHLGVRDYEFLKIPATKVNDLPVATLNKSISKFITDRRPDTVFIPFPDRHIDHRVIFDSSIVACRPVSKNSPKNVFLYETLSETHWNVPNVEPSFNPTVFINIEETIKDKLNALKLYKSQINATTPSRSLKAVESLAKFRGSQNGCEYAESFQIVRMVI
tara:strand:- start:280 stop:954 length:675 start_codon:yes stop_codon:yes gene_type:complete